MHTLHTGRVRFGAFELDLTTGELHSNATPDPNYKVVLREQVFQVLTMLLEREGQIVTREEIKERLWPNNTVVDFDQSINATIKTLRRALGDSAENPRYIETVARRGYRLIIMTEYVEPAPGTKQKDLEQGAKSSVEKSESAVEVQRAIKPHWWKAWVAFACAVSLFGAVYIFWRHFRVIRPPRSEKIMLAVLPFQNLTGDPQKEYLADGLTEEMISQLGRLNPQQLKVIARTSVMGYKHGDARLDQIGRDLSVEYVLENSLRESGDHMRLTAQLVQVKDQTHLWSEDYDYPEKDILNVEDDVAKSVARQIQVRLTSQQQPGFTRSRPVNPEAFDAYLQGYYFFERNTDKDTDMAAKYFQRATELDSSYALAWVWLSRVRNWQANTGGAPAAEARRAAREAVGRALELNPNLPEAHIQMGRIKQIDLDWVAADASFQRAVEIEPGIPESARMAAFSAEMLGRFNEALQLASRAVELDPLNAESWEFRGETEFFMGQLDEAAEDSKKALELNPDVWPGSILLSRIDLLQGRPHDALAQIERVHYAPFRAYLYALTYYALGRHKEADAALSELIAKYHASSAYEIANVYAFRKQSNEAFKWLDQAYAQRDNGLIGTNVEPLLKDLHNDPRFPTFLRKLHFPT